MKTSIRWRLLVFALLTMVCVLAASGAALVYMFERGILKRIEHELDIRWMELAKAFVLDDEGRPALNHDLADPRYLAPLGGAYWQIADSTGVVLRSRSLWEDVLATNGIDAATKARGAFEIDGPDKAELYVIERTVSLNPYGERRDFALVVAVDHAEVVEARSAFALDVALLLSMIALVLATGLFVQLRFGLAPLTALGRSLAEMRAGRSRRIEGPFPAEVAPLADDLNHLLDQHDKMVEKARNRAGSLAHGLKTPLTVLAGEIERLRLAGDGERASRLTEQCDAIRAQIDRELARARTHGAIPTGGSRSDLALTVRKLVDLMQRLDTDRRIDWQVDVPKGLRVAIEMTDLAEILGNLLDNARKWAHRQVLISYHLKDDRQSLSIIDDGPGTPADRHDGLFERGFYVPLDGEQSTGLGLAIVRDTLAEYGLMLTIERPSAGGCAIRLDLGPAEPAVQPPLRPNLGSRGRWQHSKASVATQEIDGAAGAVLR